jgi:uncharacterized protein (TIGR02246 family)
MTSLLRLTFDRKHRLLTALVLALIAVGMAAIGYVRSSSGETPNSDVEKSLIEMEREWAAVCATRDTTVLEKILADDFLGTNTKGERYTKAQDIEKVAKGPKNKYVSGRLDKVEAHFFGNDVAILYGVETCVKRTPDGKEEPETSVWTDTWLKRNGRWQIVAAQDAIYAK